MREWVAPRSAHRTTPASRLKANVCGGRPPVETLPPAGTTSRSDSSASIRWATVERASPVSATSSARVLARPSRIRRSSAPAPAALVWVVGSIVIPGARYLLWTGAWQGSVRKCGDLLLDKSQKRAYGPRRWRRPSTSPAATRHCRSARRRCAPASSGPASSAPSTPARRGSPARAWPASPRRRPSARAQAAERLGAERAYATPHDARDRRRHRRRPHLHAEQRARRARRARRSSTASTSSARSRSRSAPPRPTGSSRPPPPPAASRPSRSSTASTRSCARRAPGSPPARSGRCG